MVRPRFDPARDFVAARGLTWKGQPLKTGDPFDKAGVPPHKLKTLYGSRAINMSDGTPAAVPEIVELGSMEATPGGWYNISMPWLDEAERVRGKVNAERRLAKLREDGEPLDHHGVALSEGENGWWEVKAEWAVEAEKIHGEDAARARAAELRDEGPPPDPRSEPTVTPPTEEGGTFIVNAPWLEEAEAFADGTDAEQRRIQLREAGPPDGWEPAPAVGE
ncbi:MAG: hypothetical protein ACJ8DZ_14070 [Allosphingosinicella sp.]